jgi:glycosyltransferase involved in cell wall biosynthesis
MQDKVIFAGYVSDVHGIYAALDVVVHSSTAPEPFGLVITEAMAYGLPVVASTLGAPREIIDDGQDGFLIHPGETEKVAQAVIRLLEDDELRMSMGQRARQKVLATYDAQLYADRVGNLYKEVLAD